MTTSTAAPARVSRRAGDSAAELTVGTATDRGRVREKNEDAVRIEPTDAPLARARGVLAIVADGVGGAAAGEIASQLAVEVVHSAYYASGDSSIAEALRGAIQAANAAIGKQASAELDEAGMSSTLTSAVVSGKHLVIGHVGDSRAYLISKGSARQITVDHSWVAEQVRAGNLTAEQARTHPRRNVITRALGVNSTVDVDVYQDYMEPGDAVVLCSDGLTRLVHDREIADFVVRLDPASAAHGLVELANARGSPDNVTVAIMRRNRPHRRGRTPLLIVVAFVAGLVVGLVLGRGSSPPIRTPLPTPAPIPSQPTVPTAVEVATPLPVEVPTPLPVEVPTPLAVEVPTPLPSPSAPNDEPATP